MRMQDKLESWQIWRTVTRTIGFLVLLLMGVVLAWDTALAQGVLSAGNGFYQVFVQATPGLGVGLYTMTTGPSHPAGNGLNVLFGNGQPGTSFNTIRSYSSSTDYIQEGGKTSINPTFLLDPFGTVTPLGSTGFRTTYVLPGGSNSPDAMTIIQDVQVNGTTFEDSTVDVTTTIINNGSNTLSAGVRYFWDYQIGLDDGPVFQPLLSIATASRGCSEFTTEIDFTNSTFEAYRMVDNDVNPHPPTFNIFGTVTGPPTVTPLPTPPDLLQYVCWPSASGTAFEYTVDPTRDIATTASDCQSGAGGGDSAVDYFFGHDFNSSLLIPPAASTTVSASLFLTPINSVTNAPCVTRTSRFWFTHEQSSDPTCATLLSAIDANCGVLNLGFLNLPNGFQDGTNVKDDEDAMIEALGLYWKSSGLTGEIGGTQNSKSKASALCTKRKQMAVELIAAIANVQLLGTDPSECSYVNAKTNVNFSSDLLDQARTTAAGADPVAIASMTALLRLFNDGGQVNNFPTGIVECSATKSGVLKKLARDPTTQSTCPGVNNSCAASEPVVFPSSTGSFSSAVFTKTVALNTYTNSFPSPLCGTGGRSASWEISPPVGAANRSFTVSTSSANFDSMIAVWEGTCSNLVAVTCANSVSGIGGETLSFQTDGTNTFFIVIEGASGQYGKLNLRITSP
jgi:hypothetical protein